MSRLDSEDNLRKKRLKEAMKKNNPAITSQDLRRVPGRLKTDTFRTWELHKSKKHLTK